MINFSSDCKYYTKIKSANSIDQRDSSVSSRQTLLENNRLSFNTNRLNISKKNNGLNKELLIQEIRSHSLPDCFNEKIKCTANQDVSSYYENSNSDTKSPGQQSPTNEAWFKTWPERCDKQKVNESSSNESVTNPKTNNCDNNKNKKNRLTIDEALQNISLAYSPVTKQLHWIENVQTTKKNIDGNNCIIDDTEPSTKLENKRIEGESFSSSISTLSSTSYVSPSGSLLDIHEGPLFNYEEDTFKIKKKSIPNFFTRNVFSWKPGNSSNSTSGVWRLFAKSSIECVNSKCHSVESSSALIQHKRPSNLPAKTEEEEKRHADEYQEMLVAAKKKKSQTIVAKEKLKKLQLQQEEQQASAAKHFSQKVLPEWEYMKKLKKTQDLWWQGLPSSVRGKVWRLAIGNELNITHQLYEICLSRAQSRLSSPDQNHCESEIDQESSMNVIQLDISRTFPHLCIFQEGGPYSEVLHSILAAYVCYRPDVGYVQGMSYIAAILILNMEEVDAFICFANLLNQPLHLSAFTLNQVQMQAYYDAYNQIFNYNLPKLHTHFEKSGLTPDLYLLDWIYTIYAKAMPLDVASRVWDIFLRDGYEFIFRTALGILHLNQEILLSMDFLHGAQFLNRLPDDMSSQQLFKSIQLVTTSIGKQYFSQIVDKCLQESVS